MDYKDLRKLQRHFNNSEKDGFQVKVHYQVNDRVHLKGTNVNGLIVGIIFKDDRSYPYLKIKWDDVPANYETQKKLDKKFYDPFDIVKEIKLEKYVKEKKIYENFYLKEHGVS